MHHVTGQLPWLHPLVSELHPSAHSPFLINHFLFSEQKRYSCRPPRPTRATLYVKIEPETMLSSPLCLQSLSNLQDLCKADVCLTPPVVESRKLLSFLAGVRIKCIVWWKSNFSVVSTLDKSSLQSNVRHSWWGLSPQFISRAKVVFFLEEESRNAGTLIQRLRSATPPPHLITSDLSDGLRLFSPLFRLRPPLPLLWSHCIAGAAGASWQPLHMTCR